MFPKREKAERKIIHVDMDAFFAAVELRDNPALARRPLAIGGRPEGRGVISTACYNARQYGVRSAMPSKTALRICPALQLLPGNIERYRAESEKIQAIFHRYSDCIEKIALDEAYLDVSGCPSATHIAQAIRREIWEELQLTASAGAAPNKFLAKIASDWKKPNALFVIPPAAVEEFVKQIPIHKINGVGKVTAEKLHKQGIRTCADLQQIELLQLRQLLGSRAESLYKMAHGEDLRPVQPHRTRKSISAEDTYPQDLPNLEACLAEIPALLLRLEKRLTRLAVDGSQLCKPFAKVRFCDFTTTTVECKQLLDEGKEAFPSLIQRAFARKELPVRLLGIGFYIKNQKEEQLLLW